MAEETKFRVKIPPAIQQYLRPDASRDVKLLAAQGLVPMSPLIQATVLTFLMGDSDSEIASAAGKTLGEMPDNVLTTLLREPVHSKTLDFFAHQRTSAEHILEAILLNPNSTDETFAFLADKVPERLTTIIMNNQVRLLRVPAIGEAVKKNPHALRSSIDTMVSFLRMNGILLEGESPELTKQEIEKILAPTPAPQGEALESVEFPAELLEEFEEEEDETLEKKKQSLYQRIQAMNVGQKIKLALMGNKESRMLLIKDSNKIVATAVIQSAKITDGEVMAIANMRTVYDEVIRTIANTKEFTRHYPVQLALANNPKTPFPLALKFARMLVLSDLVKLASNRNASPQLCKIAKELYQQKRK